MDKKIITKVEIQKRNKDRVNVYINEEFSFACSSELVYNHNIAKDKVVDMDYLSKIIHEDNFIKCKTTALRIIERSHKTEKQIYDKLVEKEYDEKIIKRAIEFLKEYKFIDDDKFVELYIKEKIRSQGKGKIKYSLVKKGIDENKITEKLNNVDSSIEEKTALTLAEKKYNIIMKSEKNKNKIYKKLGDYLVRNGYNFNIVQNTLKTVVNKEDDTEYKNEDEYSKEEESIDELYNIAEKRYNIIIKSETDNRKIYKKLADYLLRRGYSWENIKLVLKSIVKNSYI